MLTITITLIDPDVVVSLPAKWGTDYQIIHIQKGCYLNGIAALILTLIPLENADLSPFPQGCSSIDSDKQGWCIYEYFICSLTPIPLSIGSSFGTLYRVSEVNQVMKQMWHINNDGQWQYDWCLSWRITLAPRRDPILLLPSAN